MKDKKAAKYSMNDLHREFQDSDPVAEQREKVTETVREDQYTDKFFEDIVNYNNQVTTLDQDHTRLKPVSEVLVRVFLKEPERTKNGLIIPIKKLVPIPSRSGVGSWAEVESPFPYSTKAVVIAAPENTGFTPGQIVQLATNQVEVQVVGNGEEASVRLKNAYLHADSNIDYPPKDPNNKYYGYLLIPSYEIKMILN
jgi:hypothetical protein